MTAKKTDIEKVWTHERDLTLTHLWHEGLSTSIIAEHLPFLASYDDGGRNAVIGRIKRLRDSAESEAEKRFWTRAKDSTGVRSGETKQRRSKQEPSPKKATVVAEQPRKQHELTHEQKLSLIDSVVIAPVTVSDEEVSEALRRRLLFGIGEPIERGLSWSASREFHPADTEFVPRCTEAKSDGPCGAEVVMGTARCIEHGGERIRNVRKTGEALKDPEPLAPDAL